MPTIRPYTQDEEPPDPYATQYGSTGDQPQRRPRSAANTPSTPQPYTGPATTDEVPPTHAELTAAGEARPPQPPPPNLPTYGFEPQAPTPTVATGGMVPAGPGAMITEYARPQNARVTDQTPGQLPTGPQPYQPPNTPAAGVTPGPGDVGNTGQGRQSNIPPTVGTGTPTLPPIAVPPAPPVVTPPVAPPVSVPGPGPTPVVSPPPVTPPAIIEPPNPGGTPVMPPSPVAPPTAPPGQNEILTKLLAGANGTGAGSDVQNATNAAALAQLQNPSPYNSQAVKDQYNWLAGNIDDEYKQNNLALDNEEARKGLFGSVGKDFHSGRAADLNVGQRTAKESLARDLANQYATTTGQYGANAINQGQSVGNAQNDTSLRYLQSLMGYGNDAFNHDLATAQFGHQQNQDEQDYLLKLLSAGYGA